MHLLIWTICLIIFISGIVLLFIEASKNPDERDNTYIYLGLTFTFLAFILMLIYLIVFYSENNKYN